MPDMKDPANLLLQAIDIGGHLIRIADTLGEDIAANHISIGLEILRARAELALELGQSLIDEREPFAR